jgi:hypothetical protein
MDRPDIDMMEARAQLVKDDPCEGCHVMEDSLELVRYVRELEATPAASEQFVWRCDTPPDDIKILVEFRDRVQQITWISVTHYESGRGFMIPGGHPFPQDVTVKWWARLPTKRNNAT